MRNVSMESMMLAIMTLAFTTKPFTLAENAQITLPKGFLLGVGSSAYQTEGAAETRGEAIWDRFSGTVRDNSNASTATDSFEKFREDIGIVRSLGFRAYRLSISWTRIMPNVLANVVNRTALEHYSQMLNELRDVGIEPIVTMLHFDHPQTLEEYGGWTNPLMIRWFYEYARVLLEEFGTRVRYWITINEPNIQCVFGYGNGRHAPGKRLTNIGEYLCAHHTLKAHALVAKFYRRQRYGGSIGIALLLCNYYSANQSLADEIWSLQNGWFLDPLFNGDYPIKLKWLVGNHSREEGLAHSRLPTFSTKWNTLLRDSVDFIGVNYYTSLMIEESSTTGESPGGTHPTFLPDIRAITTLNEHFWHKTVANDFYIVPEGLGDVLQRLSHDYGSPRIIITENGMADYGRIEDTDRIAFFQQHLHALSWTMQHHNVCIEGYVLWSLLDSFEWTNGYTTPFGIVSVNASGSRGLKKSAYWWRELIYSLNRNG